MSSGAGLWVSQSTTETQRTQRTSDAAEEISAAFIFKMATETHGNTRMGGDCGWRGFVGFYSPQRRKERKGLLNFCLRKRIKNIIIKKYTQASDEIVGVKSNII